MKQYAKILVEVMKDAKLGFPKYLDLSDPLHRGLVSEYFGGEQVMQEQYPLLYKSYSKAIEQGVGEVSYEGFCDGALIYDSKYDFDSKKIIAAGQVNLTENAKTIFVSLNILQGDTIIMQKNDMYFNRRSVQISCESNEIGEEIEDGSSYKVYLHVSWQPRSSEALRSMTATAPEINVWRDVDTDYSQFVSKIELYAPTKRNGNPCSINTINEDINHVHYNNTTDRDKDRDKNDINVCYERQENTADYCYDEKRDAARLQKIFIPVHFKIFLAEGYKYEQKKHAGALLLSRGGDLYYRPDYDKPDNVDITVNETGTEITVNYQTDWENSIPESVQYGNRQYDIAAVLYFFVRDNKGTHLVCTKAVSLQEAQTSTTTDIIEVNTLMLRWGCLAEGTKILMADGSEKEIQNIQKGDLIINSKGESVRVTELITGTEQYIYRAVTEGGRKVSASYNHPFVTEQGDKLLFSFDYQTKLLVKEGGQYVYDLLSCCYPEEYNGNVYSITVEGGENTVIADGFVTWTNDAVERIERETFVSEDAVLTSAEQEEFDRLKAWIENR